MKCPHCQENLPERTCPHCQAAVVDTGRYCSYCGRSLEAQESDPVEPDTSNVDDDSAPEAEDVRDSDWEDRKLCSDGNCIGVIGPDGRCKVCGKPYQGDPEEVETE